MANILKKTSISQELRDQVNNSLKSTIILNIVLLVIAAIGTIIFLIALNPLLATVFVLWTIIEAIVVAMFKLMLNTLFSTTVTVTDEGVSGICASATFPLLKQNVNFSYAQIQSASTRMPDPKTGLTKPNSFLLCAEGKSYTIMTDEAQEIAALITEIKANGNKASL